MKSKFPYIFLILSILLFLKPLPIGAEGFLAVKLQYQDAKNFSEGLAAVKKDGKWGFIDKTGKVVIGFQYEDVDTFGFSKGLAGVEKNGMWGFIDKTGSFVIEPQYNGEIIIPFGDDDRAGIIISDTSWRAIDRTGKILSTDQMVSFSLTEGLKGFNKDGKFGYVDKDNKIVINPTYDMITDFREGFAAVKKSGVWGFIDKTGKEVIAPQYLSASLFDSGAAIVKKTTGEILRIDKEGQQLQSYGSLYYGIGNFSGGLAPFAYEENGMYGIIDISGKIVIEPKYDYIESLGIGPYEFTLQDETVFIDKKDRVGSFIVIKDDKYGFVDKTGTEIVKPECELFFKFDREGYALVPKDWKNGETPKRFGMIHISGKVIAQPEYSYISESFYEGLIVVKKNDKSGFVDKNGKVVIQLKYNGASDFNGGLATVYDNQGVKIIDKAGKLIATKPQYTEATGFYNGLAAVKGKNGKWGFIDKTGKEIIKPQYFSAYRFDKDGFAKVQTGDYRTGIFLYGVVNRDGKVIVKPQYSYIGDFDENGLAQVEKNKKSGLINKGFKEILECEYDYISYCSEGMIAVGLNGQYGFYAVPKGQK